MLVKFIRKIDGQPFYIEASSLERVYVTIKGETYVDGVGEIPETPEQAAKIINAGKLLSFAMPADRAKMYEAMKNDSGIIDAIPYFMLGAMAIGLGS